MPELPEVETVMRGLDRVATGRRIVRARATRPDLRWPLPERLADRLAGAAVLGFRRRGKYMLMRLAGGTSVLIHLGMSGRMVARAAGTPPSGDPHEHVTLTLDDGTAIGFSDARRFGSLDLVPTDAEDAHRLLVRMGPEPLDGAFTPAVLGAALAGKRTPIRAALLDQRVVAGLGNIYVAEALFRAGLSPRRGAASIPGARAARLVPAVRAVLLDSIAAGGSSLRDYVQADGELGFFQDRFAVYGRAGLPCPVCPGTPACAGIRRTLMSGRSSFHCPRTQR